MLAVYMVDQTVRGTVERDTIRYTVLRLDAGFRTLPLASFGCSIGLPGPRGISFKQTAVPLGWQSPLHDSDQRNPAPFEHPQVTREDQRTLFRCGVKMPS